ncbi:MAG TPA: flagellar hook-length control protein FliK [Burkholderiaceae bacterium]|nr:flagellar hook-length control protein FliK [Burkholderiaceae bacterium]
MLPTLTMPGVAPPPRTSEPGDPVADGEGGAAFADALQRAQREPKPAHGNEPRAQALKPADAHSGATRQAQAKGQASETSAQPASDAADGDAAVPSATSEPAAGDATPCSDGILDAAFAFNQVRSSVAAVEAPAAPQAAIEANGSEWPHAADDRAALSRPSSRSGGTHELRGGPSMSGRTTLPNGPASARDGTGAAPLHAAIEQAAADATAATTAAQRSPSFERHAAEPSATPLAAPLFARDMTAAAAPGVDAKIPQATLQAAIHEPGFGAALGTQVSLWVREGVHEARLQLHPAELGPVTVQIALEGQAARVDFTAAVAATRESIEQSLPALAAALRESGFTLTGGGVSSHAGQGGADGRRERAGTDHGNPSRADVDTDTGHAVAIPQRWTRSLLDVYA